MALCQIGLLSEEDLSILVSVAFCVLLEREGLRQYLLVFFYSLLCNPLISYTFFFGIYILKSNTINDPR